jgi:hypothetical protein
MALLYISGLLLIAKHGDDSFGRWYFHAQKLLPYDIIKIVHESCAKNREIWMIYINHIEVRVSILALSRSPKDTGRDTFTTIFIGFPPKPCSGYYGGCNMC